MNDKEKEIKKKATVKATKKYQQTEKGKVTLKKYLQSEKSKERIRRCQQSEKNKEYMKRWRKSEKGKEYMKNYRQLEKTKEQKREYRKTEMGKIIVAKMKAKRRGFGHMRLNDPLEGGIWHHIDREHVVCIPREPHNKIYHNVRTGQGMNEINEIAFGYISEDMFDKFVSGKM